jgi:hypothetical protein
MALEPIDLIPSFAFWRDGCRTMAGNICKVLRLAGEQVTLANIIAFVSSLPRDSGYLTTETWQQTYCHRCLEKAYHNTPEAIRKDVSEAVIDYFLVYFTMRGSACQWMLQDAFIGIMSGLQLEDKHG